jgi:hypothetical protein
MLVMKVDVEVLGIRIASAHPQGVRKCGKRGSILVCFVASLARGTVQTMRITSSGSRGDRNALITSLSCRGGRKCATADTLST